MKAKPKSTRGDETEQKKALEALRESEAKFSAAFHSTPTALVVARLSDSKFDYVNESFLKLVGYERDEVIGKTPGDLNIFPNPTELAKIREILIETKFVRELETTVRRKNGEFRHVLFSVDIIQLNGQPYSLTTIMDLTERVNVEKQVVQMKRLYATLSQVNQTIVRVRDHEELYQSICDVAVQFGEFSLAWIGLWDQDSDEIKPVVANGLDLAQWPFQNVNIKKGSLKDGLVATAFHTSRVITSEDVQTDHRLKDLSNQFQKYGFHSSAVIPFRLRGKTIGVVSLASSQVGLFKAEEEVRLLEEIGLDISFALDSLENEAERKRAEEKLQHSEKKFSNAFQKSPAAVTITRIADGTFMDANEKFLNTFEFTRDEVIGHTSIELNMLGPEARRLLIERQLASGGLQNAELEAQSKSGRTITILFSSSPIEINNEAHHITTMIDITERKQAENELYEAQELFQKIFNASPIVMALSRVSDRVIVDVNAAMENLLGYSREELIGKPSVKFDYWADPEVRQRAFDILLREGTLRDYEFSFKTKSGAIGQALNYTEAFDQRGETYFLSIFVDITERKQAEAALRMENERFQRFVQSNIVGIVIANAGGKIITANDYYLNILGVTREDFEAGNVDWRKFTPPEWLPADEKAVQELRERGICEPYEKEYIRGDGSRVPVYITDALLPGPGEQIAAFVLDVTELKQAEVAIKVSEEKFSKVFQHAPIPMGLSDIKDGTLIEVNQKYIANLGLERNQIIGRTPLELGLISPEDRARFAQIMRDRGRFDNVEVVVHLKDNQERTSLFSGVPITIDGKPRLLTSAINITEHKQAEARLNQSEMRYRRLFESAKDGILILDAETGMIDDVNPFLITLLGYSKEAFLGKSIWELGFFKDIIANKANFLELQQKEYIRYEDLPLKTAQGRHINVEFVSNIYDVNHEKVIQCNVRDITERKQAEEQIQRHLKRLSALHIIDTAISSSFDLGVILDVVLQQALSQLGVDASAILLLNGESQRIEYAASRGFRSDALQHTHLKPGEGYAGKAILERRTTHISDLMETGGRLASSLLLEHESFMEYYGAPLLIKGEVKGVLEVYHRSPLGADPEWLEFLDTLAGQAAIAIDNAQLFDNLQRANAGLEQRVIQRTVELNETNIELEHANRTKDEFLATMSHELRTPLNSILGLSETLLEQMRDPLTEYQQRSLQIIQSSGSHLLELINDILDLSKIEAGKFDYYPQMISVSEMCRSSLAFVKEQAVRKSIAITYEENTDVSKVYADPRRLKQILVNLLTNAVKFTPEHGQVTLQVLTDPEQDRIQFSVTDTGIGIALEDLKQLFVPFKQVDSSLSRDHEGTGLGLALVQKLTDLHGGSVDVESEVGKGSRFTINLPLGQANIAQEEVTETGNEPMLSEQAGKPSTPAEGQLDQGIVLLAEDHLANVLTIGDYLESYGYQVVVAHDGLEAIEKAEETGPDIILMDIQMPVMDGLEATQRLRANPRFASTPIIALTALAMPGDRERCLEAGASEYMSKPVGLKILVKTIQRLLVVHK